MVNGSVRATGDTALRARIRKVLKVHARLSRDPERLSEHDDLYEAGMSPHASVNVMLALENEFDMEFPEQMLHPAVFDSIGTIASAIAQLETG